MSNVDLSVSWCNIVVLNAHAARVEKVVIEKTVF
jgi:hypothetical protein